MPAVAEDVMTVETMGREASEPTLITTTLYDLMVTLSDRVQPGEEEMAIAAVVELCNTGRLRFLNLPNDHNVICI